MFDYLWILQKFGGMGDAMDDIDESDDEGMCLQICGSHFLCMVLDYNKACSVS